MKRSKIARFSNLNDSFSERTAWDHQLTASLQQLLLGLAQPLLTAGITPAYFGDLAAQAFVKAAAGVSKCRNGRVNGSRIAVLTALRRAEVKRLLTQSMDVERLYRMNQPRTDRVIAGWRTDRRFLDRKGLPRRLPLQGRSASFTSLVKAFAGDVPPRAVLQELHRLRAVRETGQKLELTGEGQRRNRSVSKSTHELMNVLLDGMTAATQAKESGSSLQRVSIAAADVLDLEVMQERASCGTNDFLDGLRRSLELPTRPQRKRTGKMRHQLAITVVIRPLRASRREGI